MARKSAYSRREWSPKAAPKVFSIPTDCPYCGRVQNPSKFSSCESCGAPYTSKRK